MTRLHVNDPSASVTGATLSMHLFRLRRASGPTHCALPWALTKPAPICQSKESLVSSLEQGEWKIVTCSAGSQHCNAQVQFRIKWALQIQHVAFVTKQCVNQFALRNAQIFRYRSRSSTIVNDARSRTQAGARGAPKQAFVVAEKPAHAGSTAGCGPEYRSHQTLPLS